MSSLDTSMDISNKLLFVVHADMGESYKQSSYWDLLDQPPKGTTLNIVRAGNSDRSVYIVLRNYSRHCSRISASHLPKLLSPCAMTSSM